MNRVKKALPLLFILAMLISTTSFYSLALVDYKIYQKKTDLIWNINEQASLLCVAIILVSREENIDYDPITLVQQNLTRLTHQLSLDTPESITLNQSVLSLSNEVEQFKSLHAIYRNSLLFFPEASRQLQLLLKQSQTNKLIEQLNNLEHNIFISDISTNSSYQSELPEIIQTIKNDSFIAHLGTETEQQLGLLLKHAQIIADHRQKLNNVFSHIFNSAVAEQAHTLLAFNDADLQTILDKTRTMRKGFYISIIFLFVGVIFLLVRLMGSFSSPYNSTD